MGRVLSEWNHPLLYDALALSLPSSFIYSIHITPTHPLRKREMDHQPSITNRSITQREERNTFIASTMLMACTRLSNDSLGTIINPQPYTVSVNYQILNAAKRS